jgi:Transposase family tnp2
MSPATAEQMRWHKHGVREMSGVMVHPADGEAWKSFDRTYHEFANELRNVRLGLATDGFTPFSLSATPYSCWPVFIVPYNLPPGMVMKSENTFLTLVIPGPKSPSREIDIFLEPLLDELRMLWDVGVETFNSFQKQNFRMKVALSWTISDFPAYGMLSGWSMHGRLACPICMERTTTFRLKKERKASWFDHRVLLPKGHKFRRDGRKFKKNIRVFDSPPRHLSGENIHDSVM